MSGRSMMMVALSAAVVLAAGSAGAQDGGINPLGSEYSPRRGFFAESQVGMFTAFGGSRTASNAQLYTALSLGLELESVPGLTAFFSVAHGFNAASCRTPSTDVRGPCYEQSGGQLENFSVVPLELGARYGYEFLPRLSVLGTVVGGYTLFTPSITDAGSPGSPHVGAGVGLEYGTRLHGLTVGAEALFRTAFTPMLPSLAVYPRVRYVF